MNYLELAKYQIRKKANILSVIIITIALCFIFVLSTYKESVNNRLLYDNKYNIANRTLDIINNEIPKEEMLEKLKDLDHVVDIGYSAYYNDFLKIDEFKTDIFTGYIFFIAVDNNALPEIIEGTNFPDNDGYYMICPKSFYPGTKNDEKNYSLKDSFNINSYLNKEVHTSYVGYAAFDSNTPDKYKYDMNLKVVGIYQNSIYDSDENVCYINKKASQVIEDNIYKDVTSQYMSEDIYVIVDHPDNMDLLKKEITERGFYYTERTFIDNQYLDNVNLITTTIINFITILVFILIFLMLEKDFRDYRKYYKLMAYLGFHKSDIRKTYITSSIIKLLFCLSLAIILTILTFIIFHIILNYYPFLLGKMRLVYSFRSVLIMIGVLLLALLINVLANYKSVDFYK